MVAWKRLNITLHCLLWTALSYPKDDGSGLIRNLRTCLPTWTPWKPEVTFHVHTRIQGKTGTPPHIHFGQHQAAAVLTSRINRYTYLMRLSVEHSRCGRFGKDKISLCPEGIQTADRPARNVFTVLTRISVLAVHSFGHRCWNFPTICWPHQNRRHHETSSKPKTKKYLSPPQKT